MTTKHSPSSLHTDLTRRIRHHRPLPGVELFTMPAVVPGAVFITGSMLGGALFHSKGVPMAPELAAAMLDEGTKSHGKEYLREALESLGASIEFSSDAYRVRFSARCLSRDVPALLKILAEELREPRFSPRDFKIVQKRLIAELEESKEDTRAQAHTRLLQTLYPRNHPNYRYDPQNAIMLLKKTTQADVVAFHKHCYGRGTLRIAAAGDIDDGALAIQVKKVFSGWKKSPLVFTPTSVHARGVSFQEDAIVIPDKANIDLYMGGSTGISATHKDYHALLMGLHILGGSLFLNRLMSGVREKKGLTYGVRAGAEGSRNGADGYWYIWSTFAPSLLERGREAITEELQKLLKEGITAEELRMHKETIVGSYWVNLGTAQSMAAAVLANAEEGRPLEYLTLYPSIINKLTREEVHGALKKYVDRNKMIVVAAGTFKGI